MLSISAGAEPLLEGRVRLESGEPVADAQVRIFDLSDLRQGPMARAQTDGTGYFALPLAALTGSALPTRFTLGQNYPNPFNPSTIIPYQLATSAPVRLEVFNLLGQHIATLVDGERPAGFHTATWRATDGAGRAVGAGVYIYRMTVAAESQTGRMVLIDGQAGVSAGVMKGVSGVDEPAEGVYGLIVSGNGLAPYVDSAFRVEAGMAPVELVVSAGQHSAGKVTDDDCAFCDFFGGINDAEEEEETQEEEAETDSTSSLGSDLIVQLSSKSDSPLTPGQFFSLVVLVRNQGDGQAAATTLTYYRSTDATISVSDTEVGTDAVDALAVTAGFSIKSIRLTAPSSGGTYYYGACVASVAGESNTDNNCSSSMAVTVRSGSSPVTIPDANLWAAIAEALGKASGTTIYKSEMETLTRLDLEGEAGHADISDLTGLEFATNLKGLNLKNNALTDISPLSGLTSLSSLNLAANNITDISPLSGLTNLTLLLLEYNNITDISPLSSLTNLKGLNLTNITDISPLSGLTNLSSLNLAVNNITDISPLSGLTNLSSLNITNSALTDISPLSGLTNLSSLNLAVNNITDISPLSGLTNLESLELWVNNITDISPLSSLTNLTLLLLEYNNITDISPLSSLTNLSSLNLTANNITDISPLSSFRGVLFLRANNITDISPLLGSKFWMYKLDLRENPLSVSSINDHIPVLQARVARLANRNIDGFLLFGPPLRESDFDIELVFLAHFSDGQKRVIRHAARRWMSIIREDLPDYKFTQGWPSGSCGDQSFEIPSGERIDDLRIYVGSVERMGDTTIHVANKEVTYEPAALAIPYLWRETLMPIVGCVRVNLKIFNYWSSSSGLLPVWLHEIGHVLGIGSTMMRESGFIQNSSDDPHFNGPRAIAAFDDAGGRSYAGAKVPVEKSGGHWRSPVLKGELMSSSGISTLSAVTIQALADLGYVVDVTQADPYTLPSTVAKASAKIAARTTHAEPEWACGVGQAQEPIYVVDPQGRIVRTINP